MFRTLTEPRFAVDGGDLVGSGADSRSTTGSRNRLAAVRLAEGAGWLP